MGRRRGFDEDEVVRAAAHVFVESGYEATSVDHLVRALGVHRGSLYHAFGSKRGLFLAGLRRQVQDLTAQAASAAGGGPTPGSEGLRERLTRTAALDLLVVAAVERGPRDAEVAALVRDGLAAVGRALAPQLPQDSGRPEDHAARALEVLGVRVYQRLHPPYPVASDTTTEENR